jgi:class 3 adenylate cyclase
VAVQPTLLLIADIAGYTRFMKLHAVSLAHAHDVVSRLIETVIDAAGPELKLAKLEGDAAFVYLPLAEDRAADPAWSAGRVAAIHAAFHRRAADLAANTLCPCDGCQQAGQLKLKLVGHLGEVAVRKVKRMTELAGVDVIIVHRMLKNGVPVPEYLLMTEPFYRRCESQAAPFARACALDIEDLGRSEGWYVDLAEVEAVPARPLGFGARLARHLRLTWRSLPYFLGRKRACEGFRNLEGEPAITASPAR